LQCFRSFTGNENGTALSARALSLTIQREVRPLRRLPMSRKDELLKVANVFHLQAKRSVTPTVNWALHKMGDEYQREAESLQGRPSDGIRRRHRSLEGRRLERRRFGKVAALRTAHAS
jgi:hypothetical protein